MFAGEIKRMAEYIKYETEKQQPKGFPKKLYIIYFLGFIEAIIVIRLFYYVISKDVVMSFIFLLLAFMFMPPLNDRLSEIHFNMRGRLK